MALRETSFGGCFVVGTDTGVGKTVVTAALATCLTRRGLSTGVMKPVETGLEGGWPGTSDAERLQSAALAEDDAELIAPYRLPLPLAPLDAARQAGLVIRPERIVKAWRRLAGRYPYVLVEGAGGLLVPLTDKEDMADLLQMIALPAVVVGRSALGGVNQALLTLEALRSRRIPVLALLLNDCCPVKGPSDEAQRKSTADLLRERAGAGLPLLGPLPYDAALEQDWPAALRRLSGDPAIEALADLIGGNAPRKP